MRVQDLQRRAAVARAKYFARVPAAETWPKHESAPSRMTGVSDFQYFCLKSVALGVIAIE